VSGNPFDGYRKMDPELIKVFENLQDLAFSEVELPKKLKSLIDMAIDVDNGAVQGVVALGKKAIAVRATKEEIIETLRVVYHIGGTGELYTSAITLQNLFKI
jgi:alkylhydroperoxidase/carboxymuconolactone decarboxylase family protein YurZ